MQVSDVSRGLRCELVSPLTHAERNAGDELAAKAVVQAIQDFFSAIANDLTEPDIAVHGHKERSFAHSGRLGVSHDGWIEKFVPYFDDLGLGLPAVHSQVFENSGHQVTG